MDTKYMINIIENDDKPFSVSIRTGEYTLPPSSFKTEGELYKHINHDRFYEVFETLENLNCKYSANSTDFYIEMISPLGECIGNEFTDLTFDLSKIEAIEMLKSQIMMNYNDFDSSEHAVDRYNSTDVIPCTNDISKLHEDSKEIEKMYYDIIKEFNTIIECLENNKTYEFEHTDVKVHHNKNINTKIADWFSDHTEALEDLSYYCGINKNEILSNLNNSLQNGKLILNDGTTFTVLKRDEETNVALLKNDKSGFYNVACDINKENNSWAYSLVYTEDYDTAKSFYANKTAEKMDYEKYRTIGYLTENYPTVDFENIKNIVNHAKKIYQYDVDDKVGNRVTLEDLSEFIAKMYIENNYQDKGCTFFQSPIHSMKDNILLDKFYNYDLKTKSFTITNINNTSYLTSKTVEELTNEDEENRHYNEISNFESHMLSQLPNYKCYIISEFTDTKYQNKNTENYESDLFHAFDSIIMSSNTSLGFDLKFDENKDLVLLCYGKDNDQNVEIKESKIIAVNNKNEKIDIYHEIFEGAQEQEKFLDEDAYELE